MSEKKVSIFDKPEIIDGVIKSKLALLPCKGGHNNTRQAKWTESELELIDAVIWEYITVQGFSRERTAQLISDRWEISIKTARAWIRRSIDNMVESVQTDVEKMKEMFLTRCENIMQDAIDSGQKDTALKAIDLMGKALGFYRETKDVNLQGEAIINFDFDN